jgi:hypothetical protein
MDTTTKEKKQKEKPVNSLNKPVEKKSKIAQYWETDYREGEITNMRAVLK